MNDHSRKAPRKKKYIGIRKTRGGWNVRLLIGIRKTRGGWNVRLRIEKIKRIFGHYKSKEEAAEAHDKLAIKFQGVNARLNFEQPEFAAQERFVGRLGIGELIKMVKDGSYEEKFSKFLETEKSQECQELFRKTFDASEGESLKIRHHYASQFFPRTRSVCLHFTDSKGKNWTFQKKRRGHRNGISLGDQWVEFRKKNHLKDGDQIIFCETEGGKRLIRIESGQPKELKEFFHEKDPTDPNILATQSTSDHSASGIYRKVLFRKVLSKADVEDHLTLKNNGGNLDEFLLPNVKLAFRLGNFKLKAYDPADDLMRIFTGFRNSEDAETLCIKEGWKDLVDAKKIAENDTLVLYSIEGDETENKKSLEYRSCAKRLERADSATKGEDRD